ncbi:hypothetical protein BS78_01G430600 [Paspalum vaginatum]|nr:hypothetical protein BS78_01G430600 [Paspalum vaginatum]
MASSSKQQLQATTIILVAALILLVCARGHAARPLPGSNDLHMPQHAVSATVAGHEKGGTSGLVMEMHHAEPAEAMRDDCEGGEEEGEECLMRRTLVAHTDYIYTQGKHN